MKAIALATAASIALLCGASYAHGQKATERYIPIGQSPGVSGKSTYIGPIASVSPQKRTVTAGGRTVVVTERTPIWLDRSGLRQSNAAGTFADLRPGRRVEIKFDDPASPRAAEWIKVEVTLR